MHLVYNLPDCKYDLLQRRYVALCHAILDPIKNTGDDAEEGKPRPAVQKTRCGDVVRGYYLHPDFLDLQLTYVLRSVIQYNIRHSSIPLDNLFNFPAECVIPHKVGYEEPY